MKGGESFRKMYRGFAGIPELERGPDHEQEDCDNAFGSIAIGGFLECLCSGRANLNTARAARKVSVF
jgi:hypothetical protein